MTMRTTSRRNFLAKSIGLGSAALLPQVSNAENTALPSLKGRRVLFLYGGWDGHEPQKFVDYLTPWLKSEGAEVTLFNSLDPYTDQPLMDTIDLVLQIMTMSQISKEQEKGLLQAIEKNGTGMAGWHGGMCDAFRNN